MGGTGLVPVPPKVVDDGPRLAGVVAGTGLVPPVGALPDVVGGTGPVSAKLSEVGAAADIVGGAGLLPPDGALPDVVGGTGLVSAKLFDACIAADIVGGAGLAPPDGALPDDDVGGTRLMSATLFEVSAAAVVEGGPAYVIGVSRNIAFPVLSTLVESGALTIDGVGAFEILAGGIAAFDCTA